ncbi:Axonemal dynein light intermediate polypeptide 1 [Scophthalmus maximus]|uniref:Axonemal dynein light intermediate polypeptide 1 n=1 Tax=Scophthalmus maximus TaxID=52904 RepID=A0A2U9CAT5_SCOMX|nr:axonemal dynein light intermediate polypeptide 1-like [Scophthalmus maximus]AWP13313.1 Axonemal dynein light intermediate polypeptide 1 [Scophthalmus maximus]
MAEKNVVLDQTGDLSQVRQKKVRYLSASADPPPQSAPTEATGQKNKEILNGMFPPRDWEEGNQLWLQQVSSAPCTRTDVLNLEDLLNRKLEQRQARRKGICPVRRELFSQCFDELIRQVTINCAERGLLLLRARDESQMTIAAFQTLYESSVAFGMRKALQDEQGEAVMKKSISDLETEIHGLKKKLNKEKAKCEAIEKRENEKRQSEERKYTTELQFLTKTNLQLETQLQGVTTPKK